MEIPREIRGELRPTGSWLRVAPGLTSLALFALVAASLLFGTFLIFSTVKVERAERVQVARTADIIDALRDIGLATLNAETGQRGYLLTLDKRYLASYQLGAASYPEAMRRLHRLLDPDASERQRKLIADVERVADAKFGEMAETVSLVDDGRILDARAGVLSDEGQQLMAELRGTLAELERIEGQALDRAAAQTAQAEMRLLPLLGLLVGLIVLSLALGLWLVSRTVRAEAAAANAGALAEARDRADLLARELNHRVKNLFGIVLAIVKMSGRDAPEAKPVVGKITRRIEALITAHEVSQGEGNDPVVDLRSLIETALAPYCGDNQHCAVEGAPVGLRAKMAVPLGLVLHELVTNAVKYGALSQPDGALLIRWTRHNGRLHLTWRETGVPMSDAPLRQGFGSMLMASSARQLGGTIERREHGDGIEVTMDLTAA